MATARKSTARTSKSTKQTIKKASPIRDKYTQTQTIKRIAEETGLTNKDVKSVFS